MEQETLHLRVFGWAFFSFFVFIRIYAGGGLLGIKPSPLPHWNRGCHLTMMSLAVLGWAFSEAFSTQRTAHVLKVVLRLLFIHLFIFKILNQRIISCSKYNQY